MRQDRFNFNRRQSFGNIPQYGLIKGTIAPGFVDYGAVLSKNMDISSLIADRKLKESEYAENIENSPSDIDVAKIPDSYEPILTDYLTDLKMNYSEGAKLLRDNKVGSEAYKRGQELMRNATSEIANLDKEFTALQAASLEDIKNIQQDMYSDGNDENNQINTGSMLLKGQWSPDKMYFQNGKIFLKGGGDDGKDIAFSDLRLRFLKDGTSMQSLTGIYNTLVDAASKNGREFNSAIDAARVNDVLTAANSQGIRSLAYDYNFPIFEETQNEDGTTTTTETKVNYAKSDRAKKIADEQFNGNMDWVRDINNSELLRGELLSYFNDTFKTAISGEVQAYKDRQQDILNAELQKIEARKTNNSGKKLKVEIEGESIAKAYAGIMNTSIDEIDAVMSDKKDTPLYKTSVVENIISKIAPKDGSLLVRNYDENTQNDFFKDDNIKKYFVDNMQGDGAGWLNYILNKDVRDKTPWTSMSNELGGAENGAIIKYEENGKEKIKFNKEWLRQVASLPMGTGQTIPIAKQVVLGNDSADITKEGYNKLISELRNTIFEAYTKGSTAPELGDLLIIRTNKEGLKEYIPLPGSPTGTNAEKQQFLLSMHKNNLLDRKKAIDIGIAEDFIEDLFPTKSDNNAFFNSSNF